MSDASDEAIDDAVAAILADGAAMNAEYDAARTDEEKLGVLRRYMGDTAAHEALGLLEEGHGDVIDLSHPPLKSRS